LPYKASFGVYGSYLGAALNLLCLIAQFYTAAFPIGGGATAAGFFESYLAAPLAIGLYLIWKTISFFKYPAHRPLWVSIDKIDIYTGIRIDARTGSVVQFENDEKLKYKGPMGKFKQVCLFLCHRCF
jgi:amino acid transporter